MKDLIIEYLPTIFLAIYTGFSYFVVFKRIRNMNIQRDVRESLVETNKKLDVVISDNAQLRQQNVELMAKLSKVRKVGVKANDATDKETKKD